MSDLYYATFAVEAVGPMQARFADMDKRDGFEISLGMYKANLGPVTREVFLQYAERFAGEVLEPAQSEGEDAK
ncbi:hypothetical protein EV586_103297 [Tumebacillus sp. BK434]|uniref:hypothetical protein n=1 Tax=Tumebacillus sp. BK434 TaxID=2512169 RepID=UPI001045D992|nr:hypothetical protein [Tumebacillus sp. BK434]TCP55644.1 hypothetical protein EV586_103297 [Tumebacillus sp. BK434]